MCLWTRKADTALFGFVVMKDGRIDQVSIDLAGATPAVRTVRSMKVGTQAEGCVVDDRTGLLYVAEEDVGLWLGSNFQQLDHYVGPIAIAMSVAIVIGYVYRVITWKPRAQR